MSTTPRKQKNSFTVQQNYIITLFVVHEGWQSAGTCLRRIIMCLIVVLSSGNMPTNRHAIFFVTRYVLIHSDVDKQDPDDWHVVYNLIFSAMEVTCLSSPTGGNTYARSSARTSIQKSTSTTRWESTWRSSREMQRRCQMCLNWHPGCR